MAETRTRERIQWGGAEWETNMGELSFATKSGADTGRTRAAGQVRQWAGRGSYKQKGKRSVANEAYLKSYQ